MKEKKIAVLHAQIPFARGGAEALVETLVCELKKRNFNAELISLPFRWYPENGLYNSMLMWRMLDLREINGEKIDLVIPTKFPTYGVEHPNKVPWLVHQHRAAYDLFDNKEHYGFGTIEHGKTMRDKVVHFDELTLPESKKIFTISENVSKRLKNNNGIDSEAIYHPPMMAGKYYFEQYGDYILSVGRLDPLKRVDLLLEAVAASKNKVKVKVAGKGPEFEKLQELCKKLGISKQVEFLGYVSDEEVLKLYANARAIYFSPIDEDYGYVTLEALLSKKPVITCNDAGGVLEFARHRKTGLVTEPKASEIAKSIDELMENTDLCKELGTQGYEEASLISWDKVIDALTYNL